jgi:DNA-binding Xre family transcriptional regulator
VLKVSYKRLWKLLIDRDMNKGELAKLANVSGSTLTKLVKGESVNTDMLVRICSVLKCELWDIMELLPENDNTNGGQKNG